LAQVASLSHPEVSSVVKALEKRGIVNIHFVGRSHQVVLNEKSYILKSIIEPVFKAESNTINSLLTTIRSFFENERGITSVAVFGSVAKGLEKESSDIDLLVIAEDKERANTCVSRANTETISRFGLAISQLLFSKEEFARKRNTQLGKSILESYILVWGKDLRGVL
jgi:predicted nucleotidyltransferase